MDAPTFTAPAPLQMRRAMGTFLTGVAIVTVIDAAGEVQGMTINSLASISLEPPILMISLNLQTRTGDAIAAGRLFAVSILGSDQEDVARHFATRGIAKGRDQEFDLTDGGLPVVAGALAQFECRVIQVSRVGDHDVFFGEVLACRDRRGDGLAFSAGRFGSFRDAHHGEVHWLF